MATKIVSVFVLLLFGWAMLRTGSLGQAERWKTPASKKSARQIKIIEETPDYRLVKHSLGETKVPLAPKRIACLCTAAADGLVALGMRPILAPRASMLEGAQTYLAARYSSHMVVISAGRVFREGTPWQIMTPEVLAAAFSVQAAILQDPESGSPICVPYRSNNYKG